MEEQDKVTPRPIFRRDAEWDPFPDWPQPGRVFSRDLGLPPFLEPGDVDWLEWAKRRLASFTWGPTTAEGPPLSPARGQHLALTQSEVRRGRDAWRLKLDVKNFSPEEVTVTAKDGYVQISGKHEEKQDDHGTVSRCFTRKYKLPQGLDLRHVTSSLSPDGVLVVEAPESSSTSSTSSSSDDASTELVIPVQVRHITDQ